MNENELITGERFIAAADLVYSPESSEIDYNKQVNTFDERRLHAINIVYLHTMYRGTFFDIIRHLPYTFVIVTHNSDVNITSTTEVPNNVIRWFSQNVCTIDPRLSSIPIGLENTRWFPEVQKRKKLLEKLRTKRTHRNLVYVNHNISTNPGERTPPYDILNGKPFATATYGFNPRDFDAYLDEIYNHQFVVSPPGNGVDTHRKWEALYLGTIPIEKRCPNNTFYEDLPICLVDDWEQITEAFLRSEFERIQQQQWNPTKLTMSYWLAQIRSSVKA